MVRVLRKSILTHGEITVCKVQAMSTAWSNIPKDRPWERLRWARTHWQAERGASETARAAAESLGMLENTYSAYERPIGASKHTDLDASRARQFGKKFKVSWIWLLFGEGTPFDSEGAAFSPEALSTAELVDRLPEDQRKAKAEAIKALLTGT